MLVLSARDFGAKGDGVTDDTAAIQAALDAAAAAGGAIVHLEAGTYVVSGSGKASAGCLQIGSNVVLAGDGQGETTIRLADGSSGDITGIIRTPSSDTTVNVTIRDLTIDGNRDNTSGDVDGIFTGVAPGVNASSEDILIIGVEVMNVSRYGFDPHEQTSRLVIADSISHDNGADGFTLDYIMDSVVVGNLSQNNGRHGYNLVTSSHDVILANNVAAANQSVGLVVQNGSEERAWVDNVLIAGGLYHDNAGEGVLIKLSSDITLAGAEIYANGKDGVVVYGATGSVILDNTIYDNATTRPGGYDGIRLRDYSSGSYVETTGSSWAVEGTVVDGNAIGNSSEGGPTDDGISLESEGGRTVYLGENTFANLAGVDLDLDNADIRQGAAAPGSVSGAGLDRLVGGDADEAFDGKGENDFIDGHGGVDRAAYGGSLDQYDIIFLADGSMIVRDRRGPSGGDGIDVVINVEQLIFDGASYAVSDLRERDAFFKFAFFAFEGGASDDTFTGSVAADVLDGGGGLDTLLGGAGDDRYVVDDTQDRVIELAAAGLDTVVAYSKFILPANVERLLLAGDSVYGWGNELDNEIVGTDGVNELKGYDGDDLLDAGAGDDRLYGYAGADRMLGGAGDDSISAGDGADDLDGGVGADVMRGGDGDDRYHVDDGRDGVVEYNGGGTDTVEASIDYVLPQKVENLVLVGDAREATGNNADNVILGNGHDNRIDGAAGSDRLEGGGGDDTYVVDDTADLVVEASDDGYDTVESGVDFRLPVNVEALILTGSGDIAGTGNAGANAITGNAGANRLDGAAGADRMSGGLGNDLYIVDSKYDRTIESAGGGDDLVHSVVNFTLTAYVEDLSLFGSAVKGSGNDLDNVVTGNAADNRLYGLDGNDALSGAIGADMLYGGDGSDRLDGGGGSDAMWGGNGDDAYVVDSTGDVVTEYFASGTGGTDSVASTVSYVLPNNVENLLLAGTDEIKGTGNSSANRIEGNDADNMLAGRGGADVLAGNGGRDVFVLADGGHDVILDLDPTADLLDFRGTPIASRDALLAAAYASGDDVVVALGKGSSLTLVATAVDALSEVGLILA